MDLIYMNHSKRDIGVMHGFTLDLAYGYDENNFELTTSTDNHGLYPEKRTMKKDTSYCRIEVQ